MPLTTRTRPRIGDVIEIPVRKSFAYAQYTQKSTDFGALIRVLPGRYRKRPADFSALVRQPVRFMVFFPLGAACSRRIVSVVAEEPLPPASTTWPVFRQSLADLPGVKNRWSFWDGERDWVKSNLTKKERLYPTLQLVNDTMLVHMITSGYGPEDED